MKSTKGVAQNDTQSDTQSDTQGDTQDGTQDGTQDDTQDDTQDVTQDVTQGVTQGVPQDKELDDLLNEQILSNPQISTGDMAELSNRNSKNIKCQLAKCYMLVMSVVIRGHWEVLGKE